jgi:hypothetical protein
MPKFKTVKYSINEAEHSATMNISSDGMFSISVPHYIAEAIGLQDSKLEGTNADKLDLYFHKCIRKYLKLVAKKVYEIKYRITLSKRIKKNMPNSIMTGKEWKRTSSVGSEYIPAESVTILMDWHPVVTTYKGKHVQKSKLKLPEEDDTYVEKAQEEFEKGDDDGFYQSYLHKPYEGLILVQCDSFWDFEDKYFTIPLTKETFEFFTGIESSLQSIVTKLFVFLNKEPEQLMADISKMIANEGFKQIGL